MGDEQETCDGWWIPPPRAMLDREACQYCGQPYDAHPKSAAHRAEILAARASLPPEAEGRVATVKAVLDKFPGDETLSGVSGDRAVPSSCFVTVAELRAARSALALLDSRPMSPMISRIRQIQDDWQHGGMVDKANAADYICAVLESRDFLADSRLTSQAGAREAWRQAIAVVQGFADANQRNIEQASTDYQIGMWSHKLDTCRQILDHMVEAADSRPEGDEWSQRERSQRTLTASPASNGKCLNCGRSIAEASYGPPINSSHWYHTDSNLVWCNRHVGDVRQ